MYDIIIIGKGPAGISASLYAKRAGLNVAIIANGYGNLEKADKVQNYFGTQPIISGMQLLTNGEKQAKALGVEIIQQEVVNLKWLDNFVVTTTQQSYECASLIIAVGVAKKQPTIAGMEQFVGKGISYCAICDAFFYRGKKVAVLGEGNYALHELQALSLAQECYVVTNGQQVTADFGTTTVIDKKIKSIGGNNVVEYIQFDDGDKLYVDGIFIALGQASSISFAKELGLEIIDNHLVVDRNMATNIAGIYCAGDCTGGLLQISKAVSDGAIAATNAIAYVKKLKK